MNSDIKKWIGGLVIGLIAGGFLQAYFVTKPLLESIDERAQGQYRLLDNIDSSTMAIACKILNDKGDVDAYEECLSND
jgi:hypothetical protein